MKHRSLRVVGLIVVLGAGCDRTKAPVAANTDAPSARPTASVVTSAAPLPLQKGECPLEIRPGVALGPIQIGAKREDLAATGLGVTPKAAYQRSENFDVGPYHARMCDGVVVDAWLDDLRKVPDCASFAGEKLDRNEARETFIKRFAGCHDLPPRIGGSFVECENGGVRIGYGMGEFIQVRVVRRGFGIDDSCEMLADDGKPVPLPADVRAKLIQKVLDLDVLAPYWHADKPGRDPLRMLENDVLGAPPALSMFGSPVQFVSKAEAEKKKLPYFELTKLDASATRVSIEFRYPVEGVVGQAVFRKRFDDWQLEEKQVYER